MKTDSKPFQIGARLVLTGGVTLIGWGLWVFTNIASSADVEKVDKKIEAQRALHNEDMKGLNEKFEAIQYSLGRIEGALGTKKKEK